MTTFEPEDDDSIDTLIERWLELVAAGDPPPLSEFLDGVPPGSRAGFLSRLTDVRAAQEALGGLWDVADGDPAFRPLGRAGRYVDRRPIGGGGMGVLCIAYDVELHRDVAYKVMKPSPRCDRAQFLNEAVITADLRHPGIVPILGQVEDETGQPAYAMEMVDGTTLSEAIEAHRAIDIRDRDRREASRNELLRHFSATCRIVAYAHDRGVVHADVKPSNVLINQRSRATWLVDWGLARRLAEGGEPPGEGPPELATDIFRGESLPRGQRSTPSSDLFALGMTLALILADGPSQENSPHALRPAADTLPALWAIGLRTRHPEREGRHYTSANDMADDVESVLVDLPISIYPDPWTSTVRRWASRHASGVTAGVLTAVALMVAVFLTSQVSIARQRAKLKEDEAASERRISLRSRLESAELVVLGAADASLAARSDAALAGSISPLLREVEVVLANPAFTQEEIIKATRDVLAGVRTRLAEATKRPDEHIFRRFSDPEAARRRFEEAISILRDPAIREVGDRNFNERLAVLYFGLGGLDLGASPTIDGINAMLKGRVALTPEARAKHERSLAAYETVLGLLPDVEDPDLVSTMGQGSQIGRMAALVQLGRFTEAVAALESCIKVWDDSQTKMFLTIQRSPILKAAEMQQSSAPWSRPPHPDHARAVREAAMLASFHGVSDAAVYNAACALALASLDPEADGAERRRRADGAMAYLRRIAAHGYFQPRARGLASMLSPKDTLNELRTDHDLDLLRGRDDFEQLAADPAALAGAKDKPAGPAPK